MTTADFQLNCIVILILSSVTFALTLLPFLTVAQHESGTRKNFAWSL